MDVENETPPAFSDLSGFSSDQLNHFKLKALLKKSALKKQIDHIDNEIIGIKEELRKRHEKLSAEQILLGDYTRD